MAFATPSIACRNDAILVLPRRFLGLGDTLLTRWQNANLLKLSVIKPIMAALEQWLVMKQLGRLRADDQAALYLTPPVFPVWPVAIGATDPVNFTGFLLLY
jgi:hypothetical protein